MTTNLHRDRTTWLVYLMLAFYAYCLNSFGPLTPFLRSELGISYAVASLHFTAFALGILGAGLGGPSVIERIGRWRALWLGAFGMSAGAVLLLVGVDPLVTIAASFLMGLIGSLILAVMPAALADRHGERRAIALSEANLLASVISTAAPLAIGWFARTALGWRPGLGLALLAPIALYFVFRGGSTGDGRATDVTAPRSTGSLPTRYWVFWAGLVLGVSIEFCMVFWSADFLETVRGLAKADAAQAVSLFLVGMIVGRLVGSRLVVRFDTRAVVIGSLLIAGLGFGVYWLVPGPIAALTGLLVTGLGVAGLYPLIMALAIEAAGPNVTQASARATLASGVAISILPLVLGRVADAVGIASAYGVVAALLVLTLVIIALARPRATA
ncbi:MAG TPA: MFS transporter [Anaerolineales bacterium]|nr:MFS transporter [Anaerolineales bacterium]